MYEAAARSKVDFEFCTLAKGITDLKLFVRCVLDNGSSLYNALNVALWGDPLSPQSLSMRSTLCKCSCATDIIQVFGSILQQWSLIDNSITTRRNLLQNMCVTDNRKQISAVVSETSSVQCASNSLSISLLVLTVNASVPAGAVISITGLNANVPISGLTVQLSPPALVAGFDWSPASCNLDCLCSDRVQCNRTGIVQGSRCTVWCDSDSVLKITSAFPFQSSVLSVKLENGPTMQVPPQILIEIDGPNFYSPPTPAISSQSTEVLSFGTAPVFVSSVVEDAPDTFDSIGGIWRGSAPGQRNTLKFSIQPNLDLLPGSLITISGLIRSGNASMALPTIRQIPGYFVNISILSWSPTDGIIVLVLGTSFLDTSIVIGSMQIISFGLEFDTPCQSTGSSSACQTQAVSLATVSPILTLEGSRLGPRKSCFSVKQGITGQVLVPRQTFLPFFPNLTITSSTCFPGECNKITFLISVNRCIYGTDNMYILFSGLLGMDPDARCSAGCNRDTSSIALQDGTLGNCIPFVLRTDLF